MADILLFHSVYGLRPAELAMAERMRAAGHRVFTPDLYDGRRTESVDEGFRIHDEIGWETIVARAEAAADALPETAVLAGVSMGAGVAADLWARRPRTAGLLLMHGVCAIPAFARPGVPVQLHLAEPDPYEDEGFVGAFVAAAHTAGLALESFRYRGAGHYFTDATLPDHDAGAAALALRRLLGFLARL